MLKAIKRLSSIISITSRDILAYPASIFMWSFIDFISPVSFLFIWIFTYQHQQTIGGFNEGQMVAYYLGILITSSLVTSYFEWDIQSEIRFGKLKTFLTKPLSFPIYKIVEQSMWKLSTGILTVPIALIVFFAIGKSLHVSVPLPLTFHFAIALLAARLLWMSLSTALGNLAFFIERPTGIYNMSYIIRSIISGSIIPLSFFPATVNKFLHLTPYPYFFGFPVETFVTPMSTTAFWHSIGVCLAWTVTFSLIAAILWHFGLRRYDAPEGQEQS